MTGLDQKKPQYECTQIMRVFLLVTEQLSDCGFGMLCRAINAMDVLERLASNNKAVLFYQYAATTKRYRERMTSAAMQERYVKHAIILMRNRHDFESTRRL